MQTSRRIPRTVVLSILIACPLLAAAVFGGIAIAIASVFGASQTFGIGALVAVIAVVANSLALCMALALGDASPRVVASPIAQYTAEHDAFAQAS